MTKSTNTNFDLALLFDLDEAAMTVFDPNTSKPVLDNDGKPWEIILAGPNHPKTVELRNESLRDALNEARKGANESDVVSTAEDRMIAALAKRTLRWGPISYSGAPFPCTPENAARLYKGSRPILRQLDEFVARDANFLPKPAKG